MENHANPLIHTTPHSNTIVNNFAGGDLQMIRSSTDDEYLKNLPVGFRFRPTDKELVLHYLKRKVHNEPLPPNKIHTINVYEFSPQDLTDILGGHEENEWYFFTSRKTRNSGGTRSDRTTPDGYWKSTSGDKPIRHNGKQIGYQKTLVYYYKGKSANVEKTNWIMHEYRLSANPRISMESNTEMLDNLVLCRIHKHKKNYRSLNNNIATRNSIENHGENQNPAANIAVTISEDHEQSVDMLASDKSRSYNVNENQDADLGYPMMNYEAIPFSTWILQIESAVPSLDDMLGPHHSYQ